LIQLAVFAAQHGMLWWVRQLPEKYVSGGNPDDANRLGSFLGLATQVTAGETLEQAPSGERKLPNYLDSEFQMTQKFVS